MPNTTVSESRLQELSTRLLHSHESGALLEEVLDATIALLRALFSRSGEPLGAISAHVRRPPRPTQRESRHADLYAARLRT